MATLLAEMRNKMKCEKEITLITASTQLLFDFYPAARAYAKRYLSSKGIKLRFKRRVTHASEYCIKALDTSNNEAEVSYKGAEFIHWALARDNRIVAGPLIRGNLITKDELNSTGRIFVRKTLQLNNHDNIFAIGDCSVIANDRRGDREKTYFTAIEAGRLAARNIMITIHGQRSHYALNILQKYPEDAFPLGAYPKIRFISLGKDAAVVSVGPFNITGRAAAYCKKILESLARFSLVDTAPIRRTIYGVLLRWIYFLCAITDSFF